MQVQNPSIKYRVTLLGMLLLVGTSWALQDKNAPLEAKILQVLPAGFSFETNLNSFSYRADEKTRYWKNYAAAKKESFSQGESVWLITQDSKKDGTHLLEMADPKTGEWLRDVRYEYQVARLVDGNQKELLFQFADGHRFVYGYTAKTRILIDRKTAKIGDIRLNAIYFVDPRTSATLKSSVGSISDFPYNTKSGNVLTGYLTNVSSDMKVITISQGEDKEERLVLEKTSILNLSGFKLDQLSKSKKVACRVKYGTEKSGLKTIISMDAIQ